MHGNSRLRGANERQHSCRKANRLMVSYIRLHQFLTQFPGSPWFALGGLHQGLSSVSSAEIGVFRIRGPTRRTEAFHMENSIRFGYQG